MLYMAVCAALWSAGGILIKLVPWNGFAVAGARSFVSALVFLAFLAAKRIKIVLDRTTVVIACCTAVTFVLFVVANKLTTAANAIVLEFTSPVFLLILSALLFRQRFRRQDVAVVTAALAGIALFFLDQLDAGGLYGNLCAMGAGLFVALMYLLAGRAGEEQRFSGLFFGHLLTALIGLPFLLAGPVEADATALLAVLALGVVQLGIPYILYAYAVKLCPPLQCALIGAIEPLLNPVWVYLLDGEAPGPWALVGGVIVIAAVTVWTVWREQQTT